MACEAVAAAGVGVMKVWRGIYLTLIYLFLYVPIAVVVVFSFNNSHVSLLWHGFTWHWYQVLLHDSSLGQVVWHSLWLGITASTAATLLGLIAAVALFRYRFLGRQGVQLLIFMLIILPDLLLGVSLLILMSLTNSPLGYWSLLVAHITFSLPFAIVVISNQCRQLDKHILEAGRDLGASESQLFKQILIPLLMPSLVASWLLAFTMSIDDVVISYFVSGPNYEILPLRIYSMVKLGVNPEINALSTLLLAFTALAALVVYLLQRKRV
jgi:spermidine/putrescine transport system permease protein